MNYKKLLQDPRWQKKRLKIMERDNFTCRDTGSTDEQLQVHHCWYAKGNPWETPDEFLLTLSKDAHQYRQGLEQRAKKALGLIMAKTPCHYDENQVLENFVLQLEQESKRDTQLNLVLIDGEVIQELHDIGCSKQFHDVLAEAMRIKASSLVKFLKNFAWVKKEADSE